MAVAIIIGILSFCVFIGLLAVLLAFSARKGQIRAFREQGTWGERIVAELLRECAWEGDKIVSNLIITDPKTGMTTEIDHIFLSVRGCFVIEVKDYSGTIYGEESEKTWRQVMGWEETTVNTFYSPIKQNEAHIFHLKQALHTRIFMENIVVFVQGNTENIGYKNIFTPKQLVEYLNEIKTNPLSEQQRDELYDKLVKLQEHAVTKQEHIQNIREMQWKIENNICPRCGKPLVLRRGQNGNFYGCTGYPNCTFTKQIQKE